MAAAKPADKLIGLVRRAPQFSLRVRLLRALATPLFALVVGSGLVAYWISNHYTNEVFDGALYDVAANIGQQIRLAPKADSSIGNAAHTLLDNAGTDRIYWRIQGSSGLVAGQDVWLGSSSGNVRYRDALIFYAWFGGRQVRVVRLPVAREEWHEGPPSVDNYEVEIAETLDKRTDAANKILLAVSIPMLLILALGSVILSMILQKELVPLQRLADTLNRQTEGSLEALDDVDTPLEVQPLITAMNGLLARLRTALASQRKFIADAAHQLRTPLTAIKLNADRAVGAQDSEELRNVNLGLQAAAERAVRLSNQLLSLARADPAQRAPQFARVNLAALAFELGAEWVPAAIEAGVDMGYGGPMDADGEPMPVWVRGDPILLREAIANLIDNAVKYGHNSTARGEAEPAGDGLMRRDPAGLGSRVTIVAAEENGAAMVAVEDNGPGIPPALRAEVFKRFFRGDNQGARGGNSGSGLGMAIVQEITAVHRGVVRIDDVPSGMRVVISLPLAA
ncbi:MAG: sensor histidine kinase N-terminal domain-containing protein [Candidatus Protistobacter heckmanni]|nr:sensor histidine kinase N-terminal domain-containing protein [Candidatus Protistobacter heckmanni]